MNHEIFSMLLSRTHSSGSLNCNLCTYEIPRESLNSHVSGNCDLNMTLQNVLIHHPIFKPFSQILHVQDDLLRLRPYIKHQSDNASVKLKGFHSSGIQLFEYVYANTNLNLELASRTLYLLDLNRLNHSLWHCLRWYS